MKYLLPLLFLLPLFGCGTFSEFGAKYEAIEEETTTLLDGVDESYTEGEITALERDELVREILLESKARLDEAAREAGDDILTTGNDILDILLLVLFGGASGGGALALSRRIRGPRE
jgi:hypothetical protein